MKIFFPIIAALILLCLGSCGYANYCKKPSEHNEDEEVDRSEEVYSLSKPDRPYLTPHYQEFVTKSVQKFGPKIRSKNTVQIIFDSIQVILRSILASNEVIFEVKIFIFVSKRYFLAKLSAKTFCQKPIFLKRSSVDY